MKKYEMIYELVLRWVKNGHRYSHKEAEKRFVIHDMVESKLDRNWTKGGIELAYKYMSEGKDIDLIIDKFAYNKLISLS